MHLLFLLGNKVSMLHHVAFCDLMIHQTLKLFLHTFRRPLLLTVFTKRVAYLRISVSKVAEAQLVCQRSSVSVLDLLCHFVKCVDQSLYSLRIVLLSQVVRYIGPETVKTNLY